MRFSEACIDDLSKLIAVQVSEVAAKKIKIFPKPQTGTKLSFSTYCEYDPKTLNFFARGKVSHLSILLFSPETTMNMAKQKADFCVVNIMGATECGLSCLDVVC